MKFVCTLLCLLLGATLAKAQVDGDLRADFRASNPEPVIGEPFALMLTVVLPQTAELVAVEITEPWNGIEIRNTGELTSYLQDGMLIVNQNFDAIIWSLGEYRTPQFVVEYRLENQAEVLILEGRPAILVVQSVLRDGDTALRPLRPNINLQGKSIELVITFVFAVLVTAGYVTYQGYRYMRRPSVPLLVGNVSSYPDYLEGVLAELKLIGNSSLSSEARYVRTSDVLRRYIKQTMHIDAVEMTTDELCRLMNTQTILAETHQNELRWMLETADLVKFADYRPEPSRVAKYIAFAQRWVRNVGESNAAS